MAIRIVTEPQIFLVGRQQIIPGELGRFLADIGAGDWTTDTDVPAEVLVECAGRNCYQSFNSSRPGGNAGYIGNILEAQHGSVIEHANWSLIITGISRSLSHEFVRSRVGFSYSQLSQRFVDESDVAFVVPPAAMTGHDLYFGPPRVFSLEECRHMDVFREWIETMEAAAESYSRLAECLTKIMSPVECPKCCDARINPKSGWCPTCEAYTLPGIGTERRKAVREAARSVLPNAAATSIFVTANARALRWLLEQRGSRHSDAEFRRLAIKLLGVLQAESPHLFGDMTVVDIGDGRQEIVTEHRKV